MARRVQQNLWDMISRHCRAPKPSRGRVSDTKVLFDVPRESVIDFAVARDRLLLP
jgi:hypothetical protein